jgi:uncharacterized lipoprotein YmbA
MPRNQPIHSLPSGIPHHRFFLLLGIIAAVAMSGCALWQPRTDPTRFYVLTVPQSVPGDVKEVDVVKWRLGFRLTEIPAYLQTRFMVVRTGTNEIHFAEFDRWAEPLDAGIGRVLKETLASAPNVASVAANSHGEGTLDYEMRLRVLACEGVRSENGTGSIRFTIAWEIWSLGTSSSLIKHGVLAGNPGAWNGKDFGELAVALSGAISADSKTLAANLPLDRVIAK